MLLWLRLADHGPLPDDRRVFSILNGCDFDLGYLRLRRISSIPHPGSYSQFHMPYLSTCYLEVWSGRLGQTFHPEETFCDCVYCSPSKAPHGCMDCMEPVPANPATSNKKRIATY
jgi:hypothetical protein